MSMLKKFFELPDFGYETVYNFLEQDPINWLKRVDVHGKEYMLLRKATARFGGTVKVYKNGQVVGASRVLNSEIYPFNPSNYLRCLLDIVYVINHEEVDWLSERKAHTIVNSLPASSLVYNAVLCNWFNHQSDVVNKLIRIGKFWYKTNQTRLLKVYEADGEVKERRFSINSDAYYVESNQYIQNCNYVLLAGNYYHKNIPTYRLHEGTFPLSYLIEHSVYECPSCGTLTFNTAYSNEEECICCHREVIMQYSARAENILPFKTGKDTFAFLGVELEVSCKGSSVSKTAKIVNRLLKDHVILKRDGSVHNGFEIVSAPAHIDVHKQEFSKLFDQLPDELQEHESCGMHVHVGRNSLSPAQISRMAEFMNNNKAFIEAMGGRILNHYCQERTTSKSDAFRSKGKGGDRYSTLNISNEKTVEVRIFASTLDKKVFERNLEFVKALVKFCRPGEVEVSVREKLTDEHFKAWMKNQSRIEYPNLKPFVVKGI